MIRTPISTNLQNTNLQGADLTEAIIYKSYFIYGKRDVEKIELLKNIYNLYSWEIDLVFREEQKIHFYVLVRNNE